MSRQSAHPARASAPGVGLRVIAGATPSPHKQARASHAGGGAKIEAAANFLRRPSSQIWRGLAKATPRKADQPKRKCFVAGCSEVEFEGGRMVISTV